MQKPETVEKGNTQCPSCGQQDPNLIKVDTGLKLILKHDGINSTPDEVCASCFKKLKKSASQGAQLRAREEARDMQRNDLWKNRTYYVRNGRTFMRQEDYSDAAICYEKYLKVLEIIYQTPKKQLDPKLFKDRPKEITIICSVLWDLMLIYDAHIKFIDKHMETADMLARFLRFSPLNNTIIRRAELEFKKAKNPQVFRQFLKLCDVQSSRCFIATSAFETRLHPTVQTLCIFRDSILKKNFWGRKFVFFYYRYSPSIAHYLDHHPRLKAPIRGLLQRVATLLRFTFHLPDRRDS